MSLYSKHIRCFAFILLYSLGLNTLSAQPVRLILQGPQADSFSNYTQLSSSYPSLPDCLEALQQARLTLSGMGFLANSVDSLVQQDTAVVASVYLGEKYTWATLTNDNIPTHLLIQYRFDPKKYFGKPIEPKTLYPLFEKLIRHYEDNGYPFCQLTIDSLAAQKSLVSGKLHIETGPFTRIDTIILNEDVNITRHYVLNYLGLKQKALYNESKIKNISTRLREIPFLIESYPWRLDFTIAKSTLNLYLKNKSANRADVLIGLLPSNDELGGKFLLTGDIKLAFANALGQGEQIQLNWQNLQYRSPRYDISFSIPYVLKSPIGISGKFDFYKKDTSFKTTKGEIGLLYQMNTHNLMKVYYELTSTKLGSVNINSLLINRSLPTVGDVNYRSFGVEYQTSHTDYKPNPRKGYRIMLNASIAFRKILKNSTIENTFDPIEGKSFAYLYDSIHLNSFKYSIIGQISHYTPLSKRFILALSYSGAIAYSTNELFKNELYQIGGYRLLRGFDEGSLFVNQYHIITLEPKYLLSQNSYFFLFSDLGFIQSNFFQNKVNDLPYSIGAGMTFETKAGLFNISYGVGARKNQSLQLRSSKIHFGYINYF